MTSHLPKREFLIWLSDNFFGKGYTTSNLHKFLVSFYINLGIIKTNNANNFPYGLLNS